MAKKDADKNAGGEGKRPEPLKGAIKKTQRTAHGLELTVRVQNPGARALHYISDVRTIRFDPATNRLMLGLTDAGRVIIPGSVSRMPSFRVVDPHSDAEFKIDLPETIIKLSGADATTGEPLFEEQTIADADEVVVDIGWADTPYYEDPRKSKKQSSPTERWEQGKLKISHKMPSTNKPPSTKKPVT